MNKPRPSNYKTKQKEKILNFIKSSNGHITASDIINYLNNGNTAVGTATVYRFLDKLVNTGVIRKYFIDEKTGACYQYIENNDECSQHFHLKCIECGKLFHIECSQMQNLDSHILEEHGFKVDNSRTVLYGRCENCEKKDI